MHGADARQIVHHTRCPVLESLVDVNYQRCVEHGFAGAFQDNLVFSGFQGAIQKIVSDHNQVRAHFQCR